MSTLYPSPPTPTSGATHGDRNTDSRRLASAVGRRPARRIGDASSSSGDGRASSSRRLGAARALALILLLALSSSTFAHEALGQSGDPFRSERLDMVEKQILRRGIDQPGLIAAMRDVPRHVFVPEPRRDEAYRDVPIPIGTGQTLSQAYLSALMISLLELDGDEKVLEIGTGSGYDAALLARLAREVFTIEIDSKIGRQAQRNLRALGIDNVRVKIGDGYRGWPEVGPFDAILLTTAPDRIPEPLFEQLKVGGKLVIAVGDLVQDLQVITRTPDGREVRKVSPVRLGPMTGEVNQRR